jgi:hypothetical protein
VKLKCQLRGLADQLLEPLRVGDPRQFDDDPIIAFALDRRFLDPGLVDAPSNYLDRAVDRVGGPRIQSDRAEPQRDLIVLADGHLKRWRDLGNGGTHVLDLIAVSDAEDDVIVRYLQAAGVADMPVEQLIAQRIDGAVELVVHHRAHIDRYSRYEPPCRSSPKLTCRFGSQPGSRCTAAAENALGSA